MRNYTDIAKTYAAAVLDGTIPACRQIKQACQRFLNDLQDPQWFYDAAKAHKACGFIELLPHVKGDLARKKQSLLMEPFQVFKTVNLFGFTDHHGYRKYREAFLLEPRKTGKSTWAAGVALYMAFADGETGAEVWIGANSMDQANAVFVPAKQMASTPMFVNTLHLEVRAKAVEQQATGNFVQAMIGKPRDGTNPHCAILDEAHEADTSVSYDAMKTGMGARLQPLLLTITTAGVNLAGPCYLQQRYAEAVLNGDVDNPRLFAMIFTIDQDDDWKDFNCWVKANPNIGVSVSEAYLRDMHKEALERPEKASMAQTKHLNRWVSSRSAWINQVDWAKAAYPDLKIEDLKGRPATLATDLASKSDIAALTARILLEDGRVALIPFLYLPEGALARSKNSESYKVWQDSGDLIITDGEATDFSAIKAKVVELCQHLDVKAVGFDPWQGQHMMQELLAEGIPCVEVPQKTVTFATPMRDFEAMLLNGNLVHPDNGCFNWMAGNVVSKVDVNGNGFPRKPDGQDHLKIDGIVAALVAEALAQKAEEVVAVPVVACW